MTRVFRFSSSFSLVCQTGYKYLRHKKQSESCTFPHDFQVIVTKPTSQHLTTIQHTTTSKQMIKNYKYNNTTYNIETKEPKTLQRHLQKRQRQTSNRNNQVQWATTQPHYHITPTQPTQAKTTQRHGKTTRQRHHKTLTNHQDARSPPPHHHPTILPPLITLLQWIP